MLTGQDHEAVSEDAPFQHRSNSYPCKYQISRKSSDMSWSSKCEKVEGFRSISSCEEGRWKSGNAMFLDLLEVTKVEWVIFEGPRLEHLFLYRVPK